MHLVPRFKAENALNQQSICELCNVKAPKNVDGIRPTPELLLLALLS